PPLILTARVIEQEISITNPSSNKTKFSNFVEKESQLASDLISDMLRLYDESIPYDIQLATSNGVAFKNGVGESVLTPNLQKNGKDYDAIYFYKNGDSLIEIGPSLTVKASDFNHVLNITVEAYVNEELVASTQISFTDTEDGEKGDDGATSWTAWANSKDGKVDFSITEAKNRRFIGTYTGLTQSTNYLDYKWIDMSANVVIGTQNLLDGTKSFSGSWFTEGTIFETTKISEYPFEFKKWKSGNKVSHTIEFDVKAGVTYTFTAAIARENAGRLYFYLYDLFANHITSNTPRETIIENVTTDIQMFKVTFVPLRDGKIKPRFAMLASDAGWFMTGGYMLVKGN
ncbi:TPA: N-acetylmuramoyl-L-alanine amidase, partial [Streptococcus agalactiae]|nr:N-acetylmuramoyl-L-alanine amidase [Streptococcus agalactiae]